ncbi:AMP-binding protein [Amycolatopsis alkalitolerans]|uniref:AMP-binding protein n=1 Tax=Amycolatopsis alkalitolerans TaxID=2547244 RepID=A0A5C4LTJ2_9PSEU|nr:AMP-binding protein [Amycolatopsis alkalitolerans]TNC21567.1 AMP-binding protein [Amycolatopsis alkalitolerans]
MRSERLDSLVIGDVLRQRAVTHRSEVFLKFHEGELSYGEVDSMTDWVANGLAAHGVGRGQHVAVMLPNCADFLYTIFALARLGAVAVPVNVAHQGELLAHVLASSDSSTLIIDGAYADRIIPLAHRLPGLGRVIVRGPARPVGKPTLAFSELLAHGAEPVSRPVAFSDLHAIMYTSGTTGPSKGAMCSHALGLTCAIDSLDYLDRWGKTIYCPLPLFHAAGLWDGVFSAMLGGGAIAVTDRFHASRFWDDVRAFGAEVCMSVFSMIPILLNRPETPRDKDHPLDTFYMGKSILDAPLLERFGVRSAETYTSTEAGIVTGSPYGEWRLGSCGTPNERRFEVGVVDAHDRLLGPGEPGELVVRPKQPFVITTGYYGAPEATAEAFRNLWYHTGDRGYRDEDGYYFFLDRMKDAIRHRGENISAFDIECEVNLHPDVIECAATGVPSELEEEDVKLTVVLRPEAALDPDELVGFCEDRLPRFMVPRYVEFVDALPRTPTDKVAKYKLKEQGDHGLTASTWDREAGQGRRAERTA